MPEINLKNNAHASRVSLRRFPYPYRAGMAICSDIDMCSRETFIRTHRFINCPKNGLGLPVADSFFGLGKEPGQMAYFNDDGIHPSDSAEFIRQAIKDGLVDSIHSWGDFNGKAPDPALLRRLAERMTEEIRIHDLTIKVWINHGDAFNLQNMHARLNPWHRGDDPQSPYYTADLMREIGVKYYWWSELLPWPLSGNLKMSAPSVWPRIIVMALKNVAKYILKRRYSLRNTRQFIELARPCEMHDKNRIIGFNRFNSHPDGLWGLPTR